MEESTSKVERPNPNIRVIGPDSAMARVEELIQMVQKVCDPTCSKCGRSWLHDCRCIGVFPYAVCNICGGKFAGCPHADGHKYEIVDLEHALDSEGK